MVYDIEHHRDHLVVHPYAPEYLYDPVHHFIIVRPADYDLGKHYLDTVTAPLVLTDEDQQILSELLDRAVDHYSDPNSATGPDYGSA
jgi:hypothetical protein